MGRKRTKIGFVGVGRMGANMARRLKDCGYPIAAVYDIDADATATVAEELGAAAASALPEVTRASDIILTVVSDDAAMRAIFGSGADGLLADAAGKLFINCATVSPKVHREVEALARDAGAGVLEGCMASSIPQARDGTLFLMVGGEAKAFQRAKPLLGHLSAELIHVGGSGRAAEVKALVNMVMNINTAALAEGLGLGEALGHDLSMLRHVFSRTGAASRVLETDGGDMVDRDHACFFSAEHAAKDSGIARKLGNKKKVRMPLAEATEAQYRQLVKAGLGGLDKSAVAELTFPGRYPKPLKKKKGKKKKKG